MAAIAFLEKLTVAQPLDPAICDLLDGSLVDEYQSGLFTIQQRAEHHIMVDGVKTAKMFYLITCKATTNLPFVIFLDDLLSVLYLIHAQPGPEPSDIAAELACKGIPFSTHVLCDVVPTAVYITSLGLGFLPSNYRPHSSDYAAYLQRRDNLLCRNYSRAALLKGGIIGRLAHESLRGIKLTSSLLLGHLTMLFALVPASKSKKVAIGMMTWIVRTKRLYVVCTSCLLVTPSDPSLAQHTNLLLGQQQQTADVSWWPKQSI